jgi:hypothetical protein
MSYSNPNRECMTIEHDFGAGGESLSYKLPASKAARLKDIVLSATETFTDDTTTGKVQVGTAADPDAYAELDCLTTADTDSIRASDQSGAIIDPAIPAGTQVEITLVAPTGGTPAGMAKVTFIFDLDW